jgi:hypothetical protein
MPLHELHSDPNAPGLLVCVEDLDQYDPYRLAPRETENIALRYPRPDVPLYPGPVLDPVLPLQGAVDPNTILVTQTDILIGSGDDTPTEVFTTPPEVIASGETQETVYTGNSILGVNPATTQGVAVAPPVHKVRVTVPWAPNTYYPVGASVTPINPVGMQAAGLTIYTFTCIAPGISGNIAPDWTVFPGTGVLDNQVFWLNAGFYQP